ncbi:nucleotidyltransferase domain-containing protein [Lyngbya confervoides]|uniref:Nucleotidyltransferase domain-containing protein n=1 Tax=Lyngbya confervoides BDU141951 TaxID=1574623 RepID=A0ABD4T2T3_9CYAN|nr:nucleotidyltransferase domain-containing protein [Lyngbya confervoides]MCM1983013.1 nucleotidyltransferase domain-containing protein [Lyngbya confervoides BDU141951]
MRTPNSQAIAKQERRQKGWLVAQTAAKLLLETYPVEKVSLFGSLLNPHSLRRHSDIDLAVWGLPDSQYYQAVNDLSSLSSDFLFDLVQFESAQPSLQQTIVQQGLPMTAETTLPLKPDQVPRRCYPDSAMNDQAILLGQIEQELEELKTLVQKTQSLLNKLRATQDEDYIGTVALNLHSFYCGVERILKQIAQTIDRSVPDTADWHRQLLRQMAAPVRPVRPAVLRSETLAMLNDYCSFRHVVRNIYSFNLNLDRVDQLAAALPTCLTVLQADLEHFISTLEPPAEQ